MAAAVANAANILAEGVLQHAADGGFEEEWVLPAHDTSQLRGSMLAADSARLTLHGNLVVGFARIFAWSQPTGQSLGLCPSKSMLFKTRVTHICTNPTQQCSICAVSLITIFCSFGPHKKPAAFV